jgi:hypothetical protein
MRTFLFAAATALAAVTAAPVVAAPELPRLVVVDADARDGARANAVDAARDPALREATARKHLPKSRITLDIALAAKTMLDRPWYSENIETVDGEPYEFRIERHYHAPGSGFVPEGWHKGVTVYYFER